MIAALPTVSAATATSAASTAPFALPEAALALPLVLLVAWVIRVARSRRERALAAVVGPRAPALAAERAPLAARRRDLVAALGLSLLVLACMQPRFGRGEAATSLEGMDLCVCLDVSRSMLATDLPPTRLAYAQQAIAGLGERTRGDRLALVVFAGEPRLRVPLTRDVASLVGIAAATDPSDVTLGGTDLGAAIDAAVQALAAGQGGSGGNGANAGAGAGDTGAPLDGAVLLVTDGEDPTGAGRAAAERARARGVTVHCIGVGSALGSKITIAGPGGKQTFLRDREGREVVTRLDAASLRTLAAAGGGLYVDAAATAAPLVAVYERGVVPELAGSGAAEDGGNQPGNRYQWPLALALLALLVDLALPHRRRIAPARRTGVADPDRDAAPQGGLA